MTRNAPENELPIDGERLWRSLMRYAEIGATPNGGVERLAASKTDRQARDQLVEDARAVGAAVRIDRVGNIFCRREGTDPNRSPVLIGSHLDTVQNGGRFDGSLGVLIGLEILQALDSAGMDTAAPVEVVNWTNEEGSRFPVPMLGSRVHAGRISKRDALDLTDAGGTSLGNALSQTGYSGDYNGDRRIAAYLEAHIEQGPMLENAGVHVGIVTGIQARCRLRVEVRGTAAHAGTMPMDDRQDALVTGAAIVLAVRELGQTYGADGRATVGRLDAWPGAANVVPDCADLLIDLRHPNTKTLNGMRRDLAQRITEIARTESCTVNVQTLSEAASTEFDPDIRRRLHRAAESISEPAMNLVSGGGHDAGPLATIAPAGMVFVPCKRGISHHPSEEVAPAGALAGCRVMGAAVCTLANAAQVS